MCTTRVSKCTSQGVQKVWLTILCKYIKRKTKHNKGVTRTEDFPDTSHSTMLIVVRCSPTQLYIGQKTGCGIRYFLSFEIENWKCWLLRVDVEMDADFAHLTYGNLARCKRWKHCSFLQQGNGPEGSLCCTRLTPGMRRVKLQIFKFCSKMIFPVVRLLTHAAWIQFFETCFLHQH